MRIGRFGVEGKGVVGIGKPIPKEGLKRTTEGRRIQRKSTKLNEIQRKSTKFNENQRKSVEINEN